MRSKAISASVFVALLTTVGIHAKAAGRIVLPETAITHGDSIRVSDLLPPDATAEIRVRASAIALGNSPLPGAHRTFERLQIENALRHAPELREALIVPEQVDVTRWSQPLTREQIRTILQGSERAGGNSVLKDLSTDQIEMSTPVLLTEESARPAILQIDPVGPLADMHVRLWIPSEPKIPAFWVTIHSKGDGWAATHSDVSPAAIDNRDQFIHTSQEALSAPPVALKSGESVQLVAFSAGMRITSPAITLGIGGMGQQIRVRIPATGKILLVRVIGPRTVQFEY
jgi:hypothetical protein